MRSPIIWQQSSQCLSVKQLQHHFNFPSVPSSDADKKCIAIGVCAYNEEARELRRTLNGLNKCATGELRRRGFQAKLCVLVIFDGMEHVHPSCEALISSLVGSSTSFSELRDASRYTDSSTFFTAASVQGQIEYPNLNLSIIVKQDNRGKSNSLEWFFMSFCAAYHPLYAITTDTGTYFSSRALEVIDATFHSNPRVSALFNWTNILSAAEEGVTDTYFQAFMRGAQGYGYDVRSVLWECTCDFGFLPIIPGYAAAYKYSEIQGSVLDEFFDIQNLKHESSGGGSIGAALGALINETAKLTEDVNIGLAANFCSTSNCALTVQSAGIDGDSRWDPETTLEKFIQQRRRWINGGFAGLIVNFWKGAWYRSGHSPIYKAFYCYYVFIFSFSFFSKLIGPGIYAMVLHKSVQIFFEAAIGISSRSSALLATISVAVYVTFFLAFCWRHTSSKSLSPIFFVLSIFVSGTAQIFDVLGLLFRLWRWFFSPEWTFLPKSELVRIAIRSTSMVADDGLGKGVLFSSILGPFIIIFWQYLDLLRGRRQHVKPLVVLKNYVFATISLFPLMGPFFRVFCLMRFDDFSWGNRPGSVSSKVLADLRAKWATIVRFGTLLVVFLNLGIIYYPGSYESRLRTIWVLGVVDAPAMVPLLLMHTFTMIEKASRAILMRNAGSNWIQFAKKRSFLPSVSGSTISSAMLTNSYILFAIFAYILAAVVMQPPCSNSTHGNSTAPAMVASKLNRCSQYGERPPIPTVVTGLNGVEFPQGCYDGKEDEYHVFVIGDWGGVLEVDLLQDDGSHTSTLHPLLDFLRDPGVDKVAQHHVRDRVIELAAEVDPEFILNVGDNFYGGGITEHCLGRRGDIDFGAIPEQFLVGYEQFYNGPGLDGKEWLSVLGNHDYGGVCYNMGWPQQIWYTWNQHEQSSRRWVMPGQYYSRRANFATSSGTDITADMFFLDTNFYDTVTQHDRDICGVNGNTYNEDAPIIEQHGWHCAGYLGNWTAHDKIGVCEGTEYTSPTNCASAFEKLWKEQLVWLEKNLYESNADWQIIIMHHPPYYYGISKDIKPLVKKYGVDLIVSGHVHNQELYHGINVYDGQDWGKTAIIVSGGGGGIISESFEGTPRLDGNDNAYGFMDLTITKDVISISGYSWNVKDRTIVVTIEEGLVMEGQASADGVPKCSGTYYQAVSMNSYFNGYPRFEGHGYNDQCSIYYSKNSSLGWVLNDKKSDPEPGDWLSSSGNGYQIPNGTWSLNPARPDAPLYKFSVSNGLLNEMLHAEVARVHRDASSSPFKESTESAGDPIDPCDASCVSRGASYTCRDRVKRISWDANKGGPLNAVRTVNAECAGQCKCTMPIADYIVAEVPKSEKKRFVDDRFGPCEENKALCKEMRMIPFFYVKWHDFNSLDETSIEWSDDHPGGTLPSSLVRALYREWMNLNADEYTERIMGSAPKSARGEILQSKRIPRQEEAGSALFPDKPLRVAALNATDWCSTEHCSGEPLRL